VPRERGSRGLGRHSARFGPVACRRAVPWSARFTKRVICVVRGRRRSTPSDGAEHRNRIQRPRSAELCLLEMAASFSGQNCARLRWPGAFRGRTVPVCDGRELFEADPRGVQIRTRGAKTMKASVIGRPYQCHRQQVLEPANERCYRRQRRGVLGTRSRSANGSSLGSAGTTGWLHHRNGDEHDERAGRSEHPPRQSWTRPESLAGLGVDASGLRGGLRQQG